MNRRKLLKKIIGGSKNIKFADMVNLVGGFGFELSRTKGSHHIFFRPDILELVREIHDNRNLTTLFVTHDLGCLPVTCDRVVLMKAGIIWGEGTPGELLTDENLSQLYDMHLLEVQKRRIENIPV